MNPFAGRHPGRANGSHSPRPARVSVEAPYGTLCPPRAAPAAVVYCIEMQTPPNKRIRVGPAGWSYADWEGIVYPKRKGRSFDPLEYIASYFDLVEINSTFYRVPPRSVCRRWSERVAGRPDFLFTAKAPQEITHRAKPHPEEDLAAFKTAMAPLFESNRLGAVLVQFPWSFRPTPETMAYVKTVTERLRPFPTAVEVRHGGWGAPRALAFFRDQGIALCGIDQPLIGNSLAPDSYVPGSGLAYFRLHGRNKDKWFAKHAGRDERYNYLYDASELAPWRERIGHAAKGALNVFAVLNNHFRGQAVVNALQLQTMLTGEKARAPRTIVSSYPHSEQFLVAGDGEGPSRRGARDGQRGLFEKDDDD